MSTLSVVLTLGVALTWLAITVLVFGIGAMFLSALVRVERTWENAFLAVLCGLALLFGALLLWHFLFPINHVASLTFVAVGVAALVRERAWLRELFRTPPVRANIVPIAAFWIWAANHALLSGAWDDYVYEYQAIRWIHDYPIVPGLANLHGRFGFSNAHHLYAALLSVGPWTGRVNIVMNGLFIVLTFALSWTACVNLLRNRVAERTIFAGAFLAPCFALALLGSDLTQPLIWTLKADVAVGALIIMVACLWVELSDPTIDGSRRNALGATIALTCAMLFSIKLTSAAFAATVTGAVFAWMVSNAGARRLTLPVGAIVAVILAAVLFRGVLLTGYPLYPLTLFAADVDWHVPQAQAAAERAFITTYAQMRPTYDFPVSNEPWFLHWARATILTNRTILILPVAVILALGPLVAARKRHSKTAGVSVPGWSVLSCASLAALVLWFVQAPAARFAWSYVWILAASVLAIVANRFRGRSVLVWPAVALGSLAATLIWRLDLSRGEVVLCLAPLAFVVAWCTALGVGARRGSIGIGMVCIALGAYPVVERLSADIIRGRIRQMRRVFWIPVTRTPELPDESFDTVTRKTLSGLTMYEAPWSKYDTPLPSSPYFNQYLELRKPPDMRHGFRNASRLPYPLFGYRPKFDRTGEY